MSEEQRDSTDVTGEQEKPAPGASKPESEPHAEGNDPLEWEEIEETPGNRPEKPADAPPDKGDEDTGNGPEETSRETPGEDVKETTEDKPQEQPVGARESRPEPPPAGNHGTEESVESVPQGAEGAESTAEDEEAPTEVPGETVMPVYHQTTNSCGLASLLMVLEPKDPRVKTFLDARWAEIQALFHAEPFDRPEFPRELVLQYLLLKAIQDNPIRAQLAQEADLREIFEAYVPVMGFMIQQAHARIQRQFGAEAFQPVIDRYAEQGLLHEGLLLERLFVMKEDPELKILGRLLGARFQPWPESRDGTGSVYFTEAEISAVKEGKVPAGCQEKLDFLQDHLDKGHPVLCGTGHHWIAINSLRVDEGGEKDVGSRVTFASHDPAAGGRLEFHLDQIGEQERFYAFKFDPALLDEYLPVVEETVRRDISKELEIPASSPAPAGELEVEKPESSSTGPEEEEREGEGEGFSKQTPDTSTGDPGTGPSEETLIIQNFDHLVPVPGRPAFEPYKIADITIGEGYMPAEILEEQPGVPVAPAEPVGVPDSPLPAAPSPDSSAVPPIPLAGTGTSSTPPVPLGVHEGQVPPTPLPSEPTLNEGEQLLHAARKADVMGDSFSAIEKYETVVDWFEAWEGDKESYLEALSEFVQVTLKTEHLTFAEKNARALKEAARVQSDLFHAAKGSYLLARALEKQARGLTGEEQQTALEECENEFHAAAALYEQLEDWIGVALVNWQLGSLHYYQRRAYPEAARFMIAALDAFKQAREQLHPTREAEWGGPGVISKKYRIGRLFLENLIENRIKEPETREALAGEVPPLFD